MNFSLIKRTIKQTLYCIFLISTFSCAESVPDPHDNIIISKSFTAGEKIIFESDEKTIKSVSLVDRDNKFVYEKYPVYKENNVFTINRFLNQKVPFHKSYSLLIEKSNNRSSIVDIEIEKSIIIKSLCNKEDCATLTGNIIGGIDAYLEIETFKVSTSKITYNVFSPYESLENIHDFSSPVGLDYFSFNLQSPPEGVNYYIALLSIRIVNDNETIENKLPIKVVRPIEIKHFGKHELAEVYDPVPVSGCIPGSIGSSVQYSESESETRQNSVAVTINKNWNNSFSNNTSLQTTEGISLGETQTTVNSSSLASSETQSESFTNTDSNSESNNLSFNTSDGEMWSWSLDESNSQTNSDSESSSTNLGVNGSSTVGVSGEGSLPFLAKASGKVEVTAGVSSNWGSSNTSTDSETSGTNRGYSTSGSSQNGKTFGSAQNDTRSQSLSGTYVLSNSSSSTITESSALSSGRVWNMSESLSSGKTVSEGNSESISQTIVTSNSSTTTFSYSGYIPRGRFGVFFRQTSRYVKLSEIINYDLSGYPNHAGIIMMNTWAWAPELSISESCSGALDTSLPTASCFIQPCEN
jgi:hypothetical protein